MTMRRLLLAWLLLATAGHAAQPDLRNTQQSIAAAHAAIRNDAYRQAENILEQALLASPDNADLQRHLGIAYYKSGRFDAALARLNRALELAPDDAETHYASGVVYLAQAGEVSVLRVRGIMRHAIAHLEAAIQKSPQHVAARFYLVQILLRAPALAGGDKERAMELIEGMKELSPLYHQVINSTLATMAKDHQRAEQLLLESQQSHPDSSLLNYSLLSHYHDRGQCEKATHHGERFLAAPREWDDSNPADAHLLMAECHHQMGQREQSLQHYRLALGYSKSEKIVRRVQAAISEMEAAKD